jgi:hypothetical protein
MARKTREEKYPETTTFHYYNANPKNRITGDCTFRAICTALEQSWEQTVMEMAELSCKTGYAINDNKGIERYLKEKGWVKHSQPKKSNNKKYTGKEFCKKIADKNVRYVCNIGGHHIVAVINGKVNDIWDSTDGCIGNYWTKE